MRLPSISRRPQADDEGFFATGIAPEAVQEDEMHVARLGGKTIIITRSRGSLVAFSSVCPHAAADLREGRLARGQIKCPDHSYTFDVRTGRATWPEGEGCRLFKYTLKIAGEEIMVRID